MLRSFVLIYQFEYIPGLPENADMTVARNSLKSEKKVVTGGQLKVYFVLLK